MYMGAKKGASKEDIILLDENLFHLSKQISKDLGKDIGYIAGAGAAGGTAAGILAFLNGRLQNGIFLIIRCTIYRKICTKS